MSQGKGTMKTYWLCGKANYDKPLPAYDAVEPETVIPPISV